MKKYFLPLLLSLLFIRASAAEEKVISSALIGYYAADLNIPHTEPEVSTQVTGTTPAHRVVKNLNGQCELTVAPATRNTILFTSIYNTGSDLFYKSYLDHIFPSHNFW